MMWNQCVCHRVQSAYLQEPHPSQLFARTNGNRIKNKPAAKSMLPTRSISMQSQSTLPAKVLWCVLFDRAWDSLRRSVCFAFLCIRHKPKIRGALVTSITMQTWAYPHLQFVSRNFWAAALAANRLMMVGKLYRARNMDRLTMSVIST